MKISYIYIIVIMGIIISCKNNKTSEKHHNPINNLISDSLLTIWKKDKKGCLGLRQPIQHHILEAKLIGLSKADIVTLLGEPDINNNIREFMIYYTASLCHKDTMFSYKIEGKDTIESMKPSSLVVIMAEECIFDFNNDTLYKCYIDTW